MGQQRLLWNPIVHEYFGEHCYFYLVSGHESKGRELIGQLDALFNSLSVSSASYNIVFGPYDVLVRVWLARPRRDRFLRLLQGTRGGLSIDSILEFASVDVNYTWLPSEIYSNAGVSVEQPQLPLRLPPGELENEIRTVAQFDRNRTTPLAHDGFSRSLARLENAGLVARFSAPAGYKVYLFASRQDQDRYTDTREERRHIFHTLRRAGFQAVSIYSGDGFCDYVIKGVVNDYQSTLQKVEEVQEVFARSNLNAWTLVPADYGKRIEGEGIDSLPLAASEAVERIRQLAEPTYVERVDEALAPKSVQEGLKAFFEWMLGELGPREQDRLLHILQAALVSDRRAFNRRMSFLISIESDLRDIVPLLVKRYASEDTWHREMRALFHDQVTEPVNSSAAGGLTEWKFLQTASLRDLFRYLSTVVSNYPSCKPMIETHLDSTWTYLWPRVVEVRDEFAHGRLLDAILDKRLDEDWWKELRQVGQAIVIQIGLESLVSALVDDLV